MSLIVIENGYYMQVQINFIIKVSDLNLCYFGSGSNLKEINMDNIDISN